MFPGRRAGGPLILARSPHDYQMASRRAVSAISTSRAPAQQRPAALWRLWSVPLCYPLARTLRQLAEQLSDPLWSRDPVLHDQIETLEQRSRRIDVVVQCHLQRVDGVVADDAQSIESLCHLRGEALGHELSDLGIEVAVSIDKIVCQLLGGESQERARPTRRLRDDGSRLFVVVANILRHLHMWSGSPAYDWVRHTHTAAAFVDWQPIAESKAVAACGLMRSGRHETAAGLRRDKLRPGLVGEDTASRAMERLLPELGWDMLALSGDGLVTLLLLVHEDEITPSPSCPLPAA
jgi:hypothetical protein